MDANVIRSNATGDSDYDMLIKEYRLNIPSVMESRFISLVNCVHEYLLEEDEKVLERIRRNILIILRKSYDSILDQELSFSSSLVKFDDRFIKLITSFIRMRKICFRRAYILATKIIWHKEY